MKSLSLILSKKTLAWAGVVSVLALPWFTLSGAVDIFLKIKEAPGESLDSKHKGAIDVLAWSWGASQSGSFHSGSGGGGGNANFQDLSITKYIDRASPVLLLYLATGNYFQEANLIVRTDGKIPLEYLKFDMTKVLVTSISTGGSGGEDRLTENVSFNFAQFKLTYTEQQADGSAGAVHEVSYNIADNVLK